VTEIKHSVTDMCVVVSTANAWIKIFPNEMLGLLRWLVNDDIEQGTTFTLVRKNFPATVFYRVEFNHVAVTLLPGNMGDILTKQEKYLLISLLAEKLGMKELEE